MAQNSAVRITFSCDSSLRDKLTAQSAKEGIPRSQLIVEILESALGGDGSDAESRSPAVNRLIFDLQKRINAIDAWRSTIQDWTSTTEKNTDNLEKTVAELLNAQITPTKRKARKQTKKESIPSPKKEK